MNLLSFYISEKQHHAGVPLYEWLLEEAKVMGVKGGSAFRAIAGFGRHGKMHEETFFELAGELAMKVEFIVDDHSIEIFLEKVREQNLHVLYMRHSVESGVL